MSTRDINDIVFWDIVKRIEEYGPSREGEFKIQSFAITGDLNLDNNRIINLGEAQTGTDAVNVDYLIQNAINADVNVTGWSANTIGDLFGDITKYMLDTMGTGKISGGHVTRVDNQTIAVDSGYGYINYDSQHTEVSWDSTNITISNPDDTEFWVYVNQSGDINVSYGSQPNKFQNVILGRGYWDGTKLGVVQSAGFIKNAITNSAGFFENLGYFIVDNGGKVTPYTGELKFYVSPALVQYGLSQVSLPAGDTNDAGNALYYWYKTNNWLWQRDVYNESTKTVPTDIYNDPSVDITSGTGTARFTSGWTIVAGSNTQFATEVEPGDFLIPDTGNEIGYKVASVTNDNEVVLETAYSGNPFNGAFYIDKSRKSIPTGKWGRHLVMASLDGNHHLIYSQNYYDTKDEAINAEPPEIPPTLEKNGLRLGYIVFQEGATNLDDSIVDIRPLPFHYQFRGVSSANGAISHGDLLDLDRPEHHPWAFLVDGTRAMTGNIDLNNNDITSVGTIQANDGTYSGPVEAQYFVTQDYGYAYSDSTSSMNNPSIFITKVTLTIPSNGTYKIEWHYLWWSSVYAEYAVHTRVLAGTTLISEICVVPRNVNIYQRHIGAGFDIMDITNAPVTLRIEYKTYDNSQAAFISHARLSYTRIG